MAKALQRRRGTTEEHKSFTGLEGEFTYDTTEKRIVAHDGVTAGGVPMAKKSEVESVQSGLDGLEASIGTVKEEVIEAASRVSDVEVTEATATVEALRNAVARVEEGINTKFSKSGGYVAGGIFGDKAILTEMIFASGPGWADGDAGLYLRNSKDGEAGIFLLATGNRDRFTALIGRPNGYLEWDGKAVVCVESWHEGEFGYRKYSDGYIEHWGKLHVDRDSSSSVTLPIAMSTDTYNVTLGKNDLSDGGTKVWITRSTTTLTIKHYSWPAEYHYKICGY